MSTAAEQTRAIDTDPALLSGGSLHIDLKTLNDSTGLGVSPSSMHVWSYSEMPTTKATQVAREN